MLDFACGFGRHSLEFAKRGYDVTGIDITPAYIDYANEQAKKENLGQKKNLFPPLSWNNLYIKFYFRCSIYQYQTV